MYLLPRGITRTNFNKYTCCCLWWLNCTTELYSFLDIYCAAYISHEYDMQVTAVYITDFEGKINLSLLIIVQFGSIHSRLNNAFESPFNKKFKTDQVTKWSQSYFRLQIITDIAAKDYELRTEQRTLNLVWWSHFISRGFLYSYHSKVKVETVVTKSHQSPKKIHIFLMDSLSPH